MPTTIWGGIETSPESAALFSWKRRFGAALPRVQSWFLKNRQKPAAEVPCPFHCGCFHKVGEDGVATCPCGECEDIQLTRGEIEVWEAQWENLAARVGAAFDLESKCPSSWVPKVRQVGSYGDGKLQIILVVEPDRAGFNAALAQLVAEVKGFVVLTPTAAHHDMDSNKLVGRVNAGLIDLEANVKILKSGQLEAVKTADELFGPFADACCRVASSPPEQTSAGEEAIRKCGRLEHRDGFADAWFGGEHYNLRERKQARLCLEIMVDKHAFDAKRALHFLDEIDRYVRERGNYQRAADPKIDSYFNDRKNRLPKLRKELVRSTGDGSGKYYLKID